jgi:hypothetical protein
LKDEVTVTSVIAQRVDHVTTRLINDVLTEISAEHSRMDRLLLNTERSGHIIFDNDG